MSLPLVCVVGVGQIGTPICNALLREKLARLTVVSRSRNADNEATLNDLESKGAALEFCGSYDNVAELTRIFQGADTVLISTRVNVEIIRGTMPHFLAAAVAANVKRLVPCEFGVNTQWVEKGAATIFDAKKEFANAVMASGLGWTMLFTGGYMHYHVPSYKMYTKLQTLGDLTKANPQSHIEDIGTIAARCLVDARTLNKFVQFDKRRLSQNDFFEMVEKFYPGRRFDRVHVTSEEIVHGKTHGSESASSAASGHEPDRERHGINFVCWVDDRGVFGPYNEKTLNAAELFPDYQWRTAEEMLSNPDFFWGGKNPDDCAPKI